MTVNIFVLINAYVYNIEQLFVKRHNSKNVIYEYELIISTLSIQPSVIKSTCLRITEFDLISFINFRLLL